MTVVVALGGHLLAGERQQPPLARALAPLAADAFVVTHGNGPQVGEELLRFPETPLHLAVARTQGELGSLLARELGAVAIVSHVVVDEHDPAFAEPTKPVGPGYAQADARRLAHERSWQVAADGELWHRVVPSPEPLEVVELGRVRAALDAGAAAIACGGGGIPVVRRDGRLEGVDAVVDKDRASALLAERLGAGRLVVLTDVPAVYRDFRTSSEHVLPRLTPDEADALLPELPAGSMRPKVEACAAFARATGGEALITSADALAGALAGRAGTRVAA